MEAAQSDALVFFGASGDLAFKQIFPALLGLVNDEGVNIPIVGVAKAGWTVEQLRDRAKDSIKQHGGADAAKLDKLKSSGTWFGCVLYALRGRPPDVRLLPVCRENRTGMNPPVDRRPVLRILPPATKRQEPVSSLLKSSSFLPDPPSRI